MADYPNLDKIIRINFFSGPQKRNSKPESQNPCAHIGFLVYDGYNVLRNKNIHRIKCSKCNKRFGKEVDVWNLLLYQQKIKKILYELFVLKYPLTGVSLRWGVPQDKLSRFKKSFVTQVFQQNSQVIEQKLKTLPRGVMFADETFMGSRRNSNVEIVVINNIFEILSTGFVDEGDLKKSISEVFNKIPEACKKKLRILITDGEPSYKSVAKEFGGKVIHFAQLHIHNQRGEVIISKYEKLGPHHLHYKIKTHWRAFYSDKHELKFKWEIKFIKGRIQAKRGRPRKTNRSQNVNAKWRQKLEKYQSDSFKKEGTAKIFVNFKTNKLSMLAGASKWMINILLPLFKIFKGKHLTTNLIESKHSQIKGNGAGRKQQDKEYGHQLFSLHAFLVEHEYLPFTNLSGRPLYKYLMIDHEKKEVGYVILENDRKSVQTVLSVFE